MEEQDTPYTDVLTALENKIEACTEIVTRKQIESELAASTGAKLTKLILEGRKSATDADDPLKALKQLDSLSVQLLSFFQQQPVNLLQEKAYYSGQIASSRELITALRQKEESIQKNAQKEAALKDRIESGEFKKPRSAGTHPEKLKDIRAVEAKLAEEAEASIAPVDEEIATAEE